jgi:hypothetical protein
VGTKKSTSSKKALKTTASVFWDKDGILLIDYFKEDATITARYYTSL